MLVNNVREGVMERMRLEGILIGFWIDFGLFFGLILIGF